MFSIIIPLFNKSAYIKKCLKSLLDQTFTEYEVIVVNDGSTDDGFQIANQFLVNNFQGINYQLIDQPNSGVSTARNNGVKLAKYEYIAFLDADDWWETDYLKDMKHLIEEFPDAGIYGSKYFIVKNGINKVADIGVEPGFEKGIINYCQVYSKTLCMPLWTGATVLKKPVFESEGGFKSNLKLGEDFDLWIRIALKYPVAFFNKPLSYYNQDVDYNERAVGIRLYESNEHMLFGNYVELNSNQDFQRLFEKLSLYGLLPYYIKNKNKKEVDLILSNIDWVNQAFKYKLYYRILPKFIVRIWLRFIKIGSQIKTKWSENCN